jgi:hypothetical protein
VAGCWALVRLAETEGAHGVPRKAFLRALALHGAGVRPGILGFVDLMRGGRDTLRGSGFRQEYSDGSNGQVRHFCGVLGSCALLGYRATRWLSIVIRHDSPQSADGRLTEAAIALYRSLMDGSVSVEDTAVWIRDHICASAM